MATVFVSWRDVTYEEVESAGKGGIGKVSVALATSGPRKGILFAVKAFSPDSERKEEWKQAFMREVHVLRDCDHPAIVKVFDEGVLEDGRPFFVMEYLPQTLWDAMQTEHLDEREKLSIVMQLLSALDYLARRDPYVVHRDIKPKNIFLKAGTCVLGDFGLIYQDVEHIRQGDDVMTAMAQMYRTPELVAFHRGGEKPPPASDVFQLGLVAAELFTNNNPLRHAGPAKAVELDDIEDIAGALGASIKTRIQEMLIIDTASRPPAFRLLPLWLDLYRTIVRRQNEGRRTAKLQQKTTRETQEGKIGEVDLAEESPENIDVSEKTKPTTGHSKKADRRRQKRKRK